MASRIDDMMPEGFVARYEATPRPPYALDRGATGRRNRFHNYSAHRLDSTRLIIAATHRSDELKANEAFLASLSPLLRAPALRHLVVDRLPGIEIRSLAEQAAEGPIDCRR